MYVFGVLVLNCGQGRKMILEVTDKYRVSWMCLHLHMQWAQNCDILWLQLQFWTKI